MSSGPIHPQTSLTYLILHSCRQAYGEYVSWYSKGFANVPDVMSVHSKFPKAFAGLGRYSYWNNPNKYLWIRDRNIHVA